MSLSLQQSPPTDAGWAKGDSIRPLFAMLALVACLSALAWMPMLSHYSLVGDDYPLRGLLRDNGWIGYWPATYHWQGLWRILGLLLIAMGGSYPWAYGASIVAVHIMATCLFFIVAQHVLGGTKVPLILAILFGCFPFG